MTTMTQTQTAFTTSPEADQVIPAFVKALSAMEDIPRTSEVSAGPMRYKFAPLNIVLDAIRPALRGNGLVISQVPTTAEGVHTTLFHESGQWISFDPLLIHPTGGTPQNVGSAISYARRYALLSILGLATEDDDGAAGSVAATPAAADPVADRVDAVMHKLNALTPEQKDEMKKFREAEGKRFTGPQLYDDVEWLSQVEAYLSVLLAD
jgi:hypothetical protein